MWRGVKPVNLTSSLSRPSPRSPLPSSSTLISHQEDRMGSHSAYLLPACLLLGTPFNPQGQRSFLNGPPAWTLVWLQSVLRGKCSLDLSPRELLFHPFPLLSPLAGPRAPQAFNQLELLLPYSGSFASFPSPTPSLPRGPLPLHPSPPQAWAPHRTNLLCPRMCLHGILLSKRKRSVTLFRDCRGCQAQKMQKRP